MYKILPILLFAVCFLSSDDNLTEVSNNDVFIHQGELIINNNENYGLSFYVRYNPSEIKSASPHPIKNIEIITQKKTDSLITVFLFHSKAKRLPNIFKFNFTNIEGFHDTSNVEFFKIEIMDKDGNKSEYPNQYLKINFSEINKINRNNNIYENMNKKDIYNDTNSKHTMDIKNSLVSRIKLYIDTDVDVRGIQFDIKYNPLEIRSVIPHKIEGFEMRYNNVSDNVMRGLIFSLKGEALHKGLIFDFTNIEGFSGNSLVEFTDFILADEKGNPVEVQPQIFNISFAPMPKIIASQISLKRDDIYDDSWAVIIGIDKYKYSDQLNYAVKDAEAVKDMLIDKFDYPIENIRYLVDDEATLSKIKLALDDISTSADENDRVIVFYSGHGETQKNIDGTETGYIIPVEGRQEKPYATGLAMDDILRTCQMSNAKHMLFLMDACYSGLMTENVKGLSKPQDEGYLSKVANEKARQIITAGGGGEQVIERDEWQHSAFTKNLLEGLDTWEADYNKDGCITADELSSYLREHVTEDSDFQQTPQDGRFKNSGGGEFVFFSSDNNTGKSSSAFTFIENDFSPINNYSSSASNMKDNPFIFKFMMFEGASLLGFSKRYSQQTIMTFLYNYNDWNGTQSYDINNDGDILSNEHSYVKGKQLELIGSIGYNIIRYKKYSLINPNLFLEFGVHFNNRKSGILEEHYPDVSHNISYRTFSFGFGIANEIIINEYLGLTTGIAIAMGRNGDYLSNPGHIVPGDWYANIFPVLTIDIIDPYSIYTKLKTGIKN